MATIKNFAETISHSYIALDQQYIAEPDMKTIKEQSMCVWMQINKFISYLNTYNNYRQKTTPDHKPNKNNPTKTTILTNSTNTANIIGLTNTASPTNITNSTNQTNSTNPTNSTHQTNSRSYI